MIYKLDTEKYELCKKYITKVYEGNKDGIKFKNTTNSIVVNENAIDDFIDAADYAIIHFGMVNQDYLSALLIRKSPSTVFSSVLPTKPSQTITSATCPEKR